MASERTFDQLIAASGLPRIEARALLEQATGRSRESLIAHGGDACPPLPAARFKASVALRLAGRPLAYLLGRREFHGLPFAVDDRVLIPRPETELLVDTALELLAPIPRPRLLDLGTGSGVIAICLALARPDARVEATDSSTAALAVARRNALQHSVAIRFHAGDWWAALPETAGAAADPFDLVASNPPYIRADDPHLSRGDLRHEPFAALSPGPAGTEAIERIAAGAPSRLRAGGWLVVEHGHDQEPAAARILADAGLIDVATHRDLAGLPRITVGRRP